MFGGVVGVIVGILIFMFGVVEFFVLCLEFVFLFMGKKVFYCGE